MRGKVGVLILTEHFMDKIRTAVVGKLSEVDVTQAKSKDKAYKIADGGGLYLFVTVAGAKCWRVKYHYQKKEKSLSLGQYPFLSIEEARGLAVKTKQLLSDGIDPSFIWKQNKKLDINTFRYVAEEWHERQTGNWTKAHADKVMRTLKKNVYPVIGDTPIKSLRTVDCLSAIREVESRGAMDVASRLKPLMSSVFSYAIQTARCEHNPADQLTGAIAPRKVTPLVSLPVDDLPEFLEKLEAYQGLAITKLALKFLLYTFARPGEIRCALWQEIDFDKKQWRIPAERMKTNEAHIVPLSDQSIAILKELQPISGKYDLLFPCSNNQRKPMSENTLALTIKKHLGFDSTAYGLRSTACSVLWGNAFRSEVVDQQLAKDKVRAAYTFEYLAERTDMMQWWGNYLENQMTVSA